MKRAFPVPVALLLLLVACGPVAGAPDAGTPDAGTATRPYTFRALAGVSMGAIGTSFVGARRAESFDALGMLGGPFDAAYMLEYIRRQHLGGFCSHEALLAILAAHPGDTDILNDPAATEACAHPAPAFDAFEHAQSFNNWWYDDNGGTFDRSSYIDIFTDLALALGNPGQYNDGSAINPAGVDRRWSCEDPVVIPGLDRGGTRPVYNLEHNPEGRFDALTFCDGEEQIVLCEKTGTVVDFCAGLAPDDFCGEDGPAVSPGKDELKRRWPQVYYQEKGLYDPCRPHTEPLPVSLAVDLDGDGSRDFGEPVLVNGRERYDDVGVDGCPSAEEDGAGGCTAPGTGPYDPLANPDPNGDDFDWRTRSLGTEADWRWQAGEPFRDEGLDGVPGTGDYGEGNGLFDLSPNQASFFEHDARTAIEGWSPQTLDATAVYAEGGVRDIFNLGVAGAHTWSALSARDQEADWYLGFASLPGAQAARFDFRDVDYEALPRHLLFLYGDPDASDADWRAGDGAHVGTTAQAINRFSVLFSWLSAQWPGGDFDETPYGSYSELEVTDTFYSGSLGSQRSFTLVLPPGYHRTENAERTYPVLYFLHGYGMGPSSMGGTSLIMNGYMAEGFLQKMIVVYADGRCCFVNDAGQRDCDESPGKTFGPEWRRECNRGSFYVDRHGWEPGDDTPYEGSLFDLIEHVEANFRVKAPAELEVP